MLGRLSVVNLAGGAWKRQGWFYSPPPEDRRLQTGSSACRRVGMQNGYSACGVWETIILLKTWSCGHRMWMPRSFFCGCVRPQKLCEIIAETNPKNHMHKNLLCKSFSPRSSCFEFHMYVIYIYIPYSGQLCERVFCV